MVRAPVSNQATSSHPAPPTLRAISAETMKIPEPIIDPTTTIVESYNPRPRLNSVSSMVGAIALAIFDSCIKMLTEGYTNGADSQPRGGMATAHRVHEER